MLTVKRHHREFQVATLQHRGSDKLGLVVLDPARQPGNGYISLFELAENQISDFSAMNAVYAGYFGPTPPARSTIGNLDLPGGALVEIEVVAVLPG